MKAKLASELFSQAIVDGNLERVKDLVLNQGYDINMIDEHNQPMFTRAILSQNMDIINFFFEQNLEPWSFFSPQLVQYINFPSKLFFLLIDQALQEALKQKDFTVPCSLTLWVRVPALYRAASSD